MSDELAFCKKCGSRLSPVDSTAEGTTTANASAPVLPASITSTFDDPKTTGASAIYSKVGMICGAIMVVGGLAVVFGINSHVDTAIEFGADFYTESYQATALAVEAIVTLTKVCGGILAGLGAFIACYFGRK